MDEVIYLRPREKLQQRGVETLSLSELCQIIIGSGSRNYSVAAVAEQIVQQLRSFSENSILNELQGIKGVGSVQAGKIIAAIELGKRLSQAKSDQYDIPFDSTQLQSRRLPHILYASLDDKGRATAARLERLHKNSSATKLVQRIDRYITSRGARLVAIAVGSEKYAMRAGVFEQSLYYELKQLASQHKFTLHSFSLVSRNSIQRIDDN